MTSRTISPRFVGELIDLGASGIPGIPASLGVADEKLRHRFGKAILLGNEPWQRVAETLGESDLRELIRGLILCSQITRFSGGSVSPVIPLYWEYVRRFPADEPALTAWIADNRVNSSEPFHGYEQARSLREYYALREARGTKREATQAAEAERQTIAAKRKAEGATKKLAAAIRRGDLAAVRALLARGADWQTAQEQAGSLILLAESLGHTAISVLLREHGVPNG
jgi:hypothetical protein